MNKNLILLALSAKYPGYDILQLTFADKKLVGTDVNGNTLELPTPNFELDQLFDVYDFEYIVSIRVNFKTKQIKIVGDKTVMI